MPSHNDLEGARLDNARLMSVIRGGVNIQVLGGAISLPANGMLLNFLDANGAGRNVVLPPEAAARGQIFIIHNTAAGAFSLTLRNNADNATVGTVAQGKMAICACDGTTWRVGVTA